MEWALMFTQFYTHLHDTGVRFFLSYTRGQPFDVARNNIVSDALKLKATWVFFLDSDVLVPVDVYHRLSAHNLPVVSALYYRRHKPVTPAMWQMGPHQDTCPTCQQPYKPVGKYNPIVNYPRSQLIPCDVIGMGACLIHKRVIEKCHSPQDPMFIWTAGREAQLKPEILQQIPWQKGTSEDFYACEKIKRAGFPIFMDTSVICPHYGELKFVPPEMTEIDEVKFGGFQFPSV